MPNGCGRTTLLLLRGERLPLSASSRLWSLAGVKLSTNTAHARVSGGPSPLARPLPSSRILPFMLLLCASKRDMQIEPDGSARGPAAVLHDSGFSSLLVPLMPLLLSRPRSCGPPRCLLQLRGQRRLREFSSPLPKDSPTRSSLPLRLRSIWVALGPMTSFCLAKVTGLTSPPMRAGR